MVTTKTVYKYISYDLRVYYSYDGAYYRCTDGLNSDNIIKEFALIQECSEIDLRAMSEIRSRRSFISHIENGTTNS